ncbi:MAG: PocR ligand-binding domain-containing protein, partial [Planctomycetota bacterium]|nr:PocR ligand-binding domain-containing protein [Planctomycetota bacterium]
MTDSTSPVSPLTLPAAGVRAASPQTVRLVDLIDRETLQAIQDGFSQLAHAAASIRDAEGRTTPVKYVCHAGLTQFAAAIHMEDRVLGTIVLGDLPERPLSAEEIAVLARVHHVDERELASAAAELRPMDERQMRSAIAFLQLLANTLTRLCYQQAVLQETVDELRLLSETSRLLSSTLDPDAVLDNIVRTMAEVMHVKACSVR